MNASRSPLHARHEALGAKLAEFGGWLMPTEYAAGTVAEHTAVREAVGVFDVSHLGTAWVRGPGAAAYLNSALSNDLDKIAPGKAQYTLCCDEDSGGVVDDMIAYLYGPERVLLVPNAANSDEVVRRLVAAAPEGVDVDDEHGDYAIVAVQGPRSDAVLTEAGLPVGHEYMSFVEASVEDETVLVCRSGYTGERGYELVVPARVAGAVWDSLMAAGEQYGVLACGLGSRDTLRTEMGYPLHGQDLSLEITPPEGRAGWAVAWDKPAFWGREVLLAAKEAGPTRRMRGLVAAGRGIPRPGMAVYLDAEDEQPAGEITSGTFSPTLRKGVALALVPPGMDDGARVAVDIRGRREPFTVTKPPFVTPGVRGQE